MSTPVPGDTAVCRHCGQPITYGTETEPGFLPRTGWRDRLAHPLTCYRAASLTHSPRD